MIVINNFIVIARQSNQVSFCGKNMIDSIVSSKPDRQSIVDFIMNSPVMTIDNQGYRSFSMENIFIIAEEGDDDTEEPSEKGFSKRHENVKRTVIAYQR